MNKAQTAEAIKVMQAYVDGAEIAFVYLNDEFNKGWNKRWRDICDPIWNWQDAEYRCKSAKPREFWLGREPNKTEYEVMTFNPIETDNERHVYADWKWIKVREV